MGQRLVTAKNAVGSWHIWHIVLIAVTAFVGCGGSTSTGNTAGGAGGSAGSDAGGGGSAGTGAGAVHAPCSACAPDAYTCVVTGQESATLSITSRTASGCSGTLQGNTAELACGTSTICYAGKCVPFSDDSKGLHFSVHGSAAVCFPN